MQTTKSILITGCSSGIGLCAAQTLQQRGYQVFAAVRKPVDQQRLQQLGLNSLLLDVNDSDSIQAGVETVLAQTGGTLYALCNNAGFAQPGAVEDLTREALRAQFETNLFGLQELTNRVIPIMRRQGEGRIINISSVLGLVTMTYRGAYCASKFALEALTQALRMELHQSGIQVSLIEPGPISTAIWDNALSVYQRNVLPIESVHQTKYTHMASHFMQNKGQSIFTRPPAAVVKKICHALESTRPKMHYYVTVPTYLLTGLKRILPDRWLEFLLRIISQYEME